MLLKLLRTAWSLDHEEDNDIEAGRVARILLKKFSFGDKGVSALTLGPCKAEKILVFRIRLQVWCFV